MNAILPRKIPKPPKRASRWRSQAHCNHVRSYACCNCGTFAGIEVAHVRLGAGAGLSQKPDDFRTVSLCKPCHDQQHRVGERSFWIGRDVEEIIAMFVRTSPRRHEIETVLRERGL